MYPNRIKGSFGMKRYELKNMEETVSSMGSNRELGICGGKLIVTEGGLGGSVFWTGARATLSDDCDACACESG